MTIPNGIQAASEGTLDPTRPDPTSPVSTSGQVSKERKEAEAVLVILAEVGPDLDLDEIECLLAGFTHTNVELEVRRFAQTWSGGPLRSSLPLQRWLEKARPRAETPAPGRGGSLSADEIERRVARYRRSISAGEFYGEPWFRPDDFDDMAELERTVEDQRSKLEAR